MSSKGVATFLGSGTPVVHRLQVELRSVGAICNRKDIIFADREDHASLIDGFILSQAKLVRFKHNDMADLERKLEMHKDFTGGKLLAWRRLLHDRELALRGPGRRAWPEVRLPNPSPEAHAIGTIGPEGRGLRGALRRPTTWT